MNRFVKVFALLIMSLLLLVSGLNRALDHFSAAGSQSSLAWYNEKGEVILACNGDLGSLHAAKPARAFLHRT